MNARRNRLNRSLWLAGILIASGGCVLDVPLNPGGLFSGLAGDLQSFGSQVERALSDPLGAKPFPRLLESDGQQLFYTTNLTDVRIRFRGRGNDIVIPSVLGPSNVYRLGAGPPQVVSLLQPTVGVVRLDTDGRFLAALQLVDLAEGDFRTRVIYEDLHVAQIVTLFEPTDDDLMPVELAVANGRTAYVLQDADNIAAVIRVANLFDPAEQTEIAVGQRTPVRLRGDRLAYLDRSDGLTQRVTLRNLVTDEEIVVDELPLDEPVRIFLTLNKLVWSAGGLSGVGGERILAYHVPTGELSVTAEGLPGFLVGASDDYLLTEEFFTLGTRGRGRIGVWRHEIGGASKRLAAFDADGFAGQSRIAGDNAVWVNPERRIVLQPLAGGHRRVVRPF